MHVCLCSICYVKMCTVPTWDTNCVRKLLFDSGIIPSKYDRRCSNWDDKWTLTIKYKYTVWNTCRHTTYKLLKLLILLCKTVTFNSQAT